MSFLRNSASKDGQTVCSYTDAGRELSSRLKHKSYVTPSAISANVPDFLGTRWACVLDRKKERHEGKSAENVGESITRLHTGASCRRRLLFHLLEIRARVLRHSCLREDARGTARAMCRAARVLEKRNWSKLRGVHYTITRLVTMKPC